MSNNLVRMRFAAVAVRIETTPGVDPIGGTPIASDYIGAECEVQFDPTIIELPELTGTLDKSASIVGGLKPRIRLRMPLRGSGTAGTAPDWGKLLRCSTMVETVTGAAIGVPTAAASGTTSTVTAAAPFGTTAQQYRGMPLLVTGDQVFPTVITDYTAGRIITMAETRTAGLTVSSLLQIPINVLYSPTSDEANYKTCTIYFYGDGLRWDFVGAMGTPTLELTTGGLGFLTFELRGQFSAKSATAVPALAAAAVRPTPPRFVGGKMRLDGALAQVRTLTLNGGVNTVLPDDPESAEGYGPALPIERDVGGSLDPLMNTTNSVALFNNFRNGTNMRMAAMLGTTAGNRFAIMCPAVKATAMDPSARDGLGQHGLQFQADGADSAFFIAQY